MGGRARQRAWIRPAPPACTHVTIWELAAAVLRRWPAPPAPGAPQLVVLLPLTVGDPFPGTAFRLATWHDHIWALLSPHLPADHHERVRQALYDPHAEAARLCLHPIVTLHMADAHATPAAPRGEPHTRIRAAMTSQSDFVLFDGATQDRLEATLWRHETPEPEPRPVTEFRSTRWL